MYNKEEVTAYLITESVSEPARVSNVECFDKDSLFYVRFEARLQDFNIKNRNNRIYKGAAMVPSLNAEHIFELEKNGSWFGEAGHPVTDDIKRILTIDPKLISHRIVSHTVDTNGCKGVVETICSDYGTQMGRLILQNMEPAFSLRALAPIVKKPDGSQVVETKAHVVTYDWVILPSHKTAYRDQSKPVEKIIKKIACDGNTVTECAITPVTESSILNYISSESTKVKVVSNLSEIALDSLSLSEDARHAILKENGRTFIIPLEDRIKSDIRSYLLNL